MPVLKSVGGGAEIFAAPPSLDLPNSPPQTQVLNVDLSMTLSRRKVGVVFIEMGCEEWSEMMSRTVALQGMDQELPAKVEEEEKKRGKEVNHKTTQRGLRIIGILNNCEKVNQGEAVTLGSWQGGIGGYPPANTLSLTTLTPKGIADCRHGV